MPPAAEIAGTVTRILYRKEDFVIAKIACDDETRKASGMKEIAVKGNASEAAFAEGLPYRLAGQWQDDPKYGRQFSFRAFASVQPTGRSAVTKYLQQCPGIGPRSAELLWQNYAENAVQMLRENPEAVTQAIPTIKLDIAQKASQRLQKGSKEEAVRLQLLKLFDGHRIPGKVTEYLVKRYQDKAAQHVQHNPFRLMPLSGVSFDKADAIYCKLNLPKGRLCRQAYAAISVIDKDRDGNTWFSQSTLENAIISIIGPHAKPQQALEYALRARLLCKRNACPDCKGEEIVQGDPLAWAFGGEASGEAAEWLPCPTCQGKTQYLYYAPLMYARAEERIARRVAQARNELPRWPTVEAVGEGKWGCTTHQAEELAKATTSMFGILAGSPGTGKTFTVAQLVKSILADHGSDAVAVCAPTGKAAVRCSDTMQRYGISVTATTIHRLLKVEIDNGNWGFKYNESRPLPFKFVIVDESSMIPSALMADLLDACGAGTHVLFIGDTNQLPPIGHGAPLRDFITAGLPTGKLTEIRRNSGTIVEVCAAIRDGQPWEFADVEDLSEDAPKNLVLLPAGPREIAEAIQDKIVEIDRDGYFDPIWNVQVIVAVNANSSVGREVLNNALQNQLNPAGETHPKWKIRLGDKIINTANTTYTEYKEPGQGKATREHYVANGEIGRAISFDSRDRLVCEFSLPRRIVAIPTGETSQNIELAYAVTGHKMQGSQTPCVIVALDPAGGAMHGVCSREWFYTAISRAEKVCFCVGSKETAERYCRRVVTPVRKTLLVDQVAAAVASEVQLPPRRPARETLEEFFDEPEIENHDQEPAEESAEETDPETTSVKEWNDEHICF